MKKYEIIFSDIDGTLLNDCHQVTDATGREIQRVTKGGIPFVLVSSRMPEAIRPIQEMAGIRGPVISYGGAFILDETGKVLHSEGLKPAAAARVCGLIEERFPQISWNMYGGHTWLCQDRECSRIAREEAITGTHPVRCGLHETESLDTVHKILCMGEPEDITELQQYLNKNSRGLFTCKSAPFYLEIVKEGIAKGAAVKLLCGILGIPVENSLAFGDNYNDLDMLAAAGTGYAMENAPKAVAEAAGHVTKSNNEDGIALVLREIFSAQ